MPVRMLSQGSPGQELHPAVNHHPQAKAGHDGVQRPGDLLLRSLFLRGQNVFQGVANEDSYISMLLTEAVGPGPFFLGVWARAAL